MNVPINKPSFSLRRMQKDLIGYTDTYDYSAVDNAVSFQYNNKDMIIKLEHYPFKPPYLEINKKHLIYCPTAFPKRLWDRYMARHPNKCLCCKSILCANNWTPSFRLGNILAEYDTFTEELKTIAKVLVFEHSFLPDDMIREIVSFLL